MVFIGCPEGGGDEEGGQNNFTSDLSGISFELVKNEYAPTSGSNKGLQGKAVDPKIMQGNKLTKGDVITLDITFTLDKTLDADLQVCFVDTSADASYWGPLTWDGDADEDERYAISKDELIADTQITITVDFEVLKTASGISAAANALVFESASSWSLDPVTVTIVSGTVTVKSGGGGDEPEEPGEEVDRTAFDAAEGLKGLTNEWGTDGSLVADADTGIISTTGISVAALFGVAVPAGVITGTDGTITIRYIAVAKNGVPVKLTAKKNNSAGDLSPSTYIDFVGDGTEQTYDIPAERYGEIPTVLYFQNNSPTASEWELKILGITYTPGTPSGPTKVDTTITLTAPVTGEVPATTATGTGFTATVEWTDEDGNALTGNFEPETVYVATITLTLEDDYTFDGIEADSFTVAGGTAENAAGTESDTTLVVIVTFPATEEE